jgi:hypothetical protein
MSGEFLRIKVTSDPITRAQTLFADCAALNGAAERGKRDDRVVKRTNSPPPPALYASTLSLFHLANAFNSWHSLLTKLRAN